MFYLFSKNTQLEIVKKNLPSEDAEKIRELASIFSLWKAECTGRIHEKTDSFLDQCEIDSFLPKKLKGIDLFLLIEAIHGKEQADFIKVNWFK